jgi:hypothetical protein
MKLYVSFAIGILMVLSQAACTSPGCKIQESVVEGLTPVIAANLQCSNPQAIEADLNKVIGGIGLCKKTSQMKGLPGPICQMIADLVIEGAAKIAIPSSWGCTAGNAKELLSTLIVQGCKQI